MHRKTYCAWVSARRRCTNPKDPGYHNYGGRGIKMLWATYDDFVRDMGTSPKGLSLDRIDNDGNYGPGNCRWATTKANMRNRRTNNRLTIRGETLILTEWAERADIKPRALWMRLYRTGWTPEEAVGLIPRKRQPKTHCRNGHEWTELGDCPECVRLRFKRFRSKHR